MIVGFDLLLARNQSDGIRSIPASPIRLAAQETDVWKSRGRSLRDHQLADHLTIESGDPMYTKDADALGRMGAITPRAPTGCQPGPTQRSVRLLRARPGTWRSHPPASRIEYERGHFVARLDSATDPPVIPRASSSPAQSVRPDGAR